MTPHDLFGRTIEKDKFCIVPIDNNQVTLAYIDQVLDGSGSVIVRLLLPNCEVIYGKEYLFPASQIYVISHLLVFNSKIDYHRFIKEQIYE